MRLIKRRWLKEERSQERLNRGGLILKYLILAINPGSTSTKIALYENEKELFKENIEHPQQELEKYSRIIDQIPMRRELILDALKKKGYAVKDLSIVMGRGGLFPPIRTGGYRVNKAMLDMIMNEEIPSHASNLGAVLANEIAEEAGVNAYIYDAVSAGELSEVAEMTGFPQVKRRSFCHVLNSRAVAMRYAESIGKKYEDLSLIVAHLGGGITFSVHEHGKIIDSLSDDNGAFSPERAGSVPLLQLIDLCYSGEYTKPEMIKKVRGSGGLRALVGTSDVRIIEQRAAEGDREAKIALQAQVLQIAKGIGLLSPWLGRRCEAIILTGGLAYSKYLTEEVQKMVDFIAPVVILPGEHEMEALALGGLRIVEGKETAREM